ncbi:hypothetical protein [Undibacterium crateris]|uniref:hypothetical protein n=1 Tax=Undibacterium crateris TaxID=2528175 RepID=UPI00138A3999|nr:hypothetical protein [Undibacterium crateris]NDI85329.1 hypothetical protein [Undibacterium crateris]
MKFAISLLSFGVLLVALPVLGNMYNNHEFTNLVAVIAATNTTVNPPEPSILWYAISAGIGAILITVGIVVGYLKEFTKKASA